MVTKTLSDQKIIDTYNRLVADGHPDPLGFIARADIKTHFNPDGVYKDYVGAFGVNKKLAKALLYDEEDLYNTDVCYLASLTIDMNNYRKADQDIDSMYRLSNKSSDASNEIFLRKLDEKRNWYKDRLVFNNGILFSIDRNHELKDDTPESVSNKAVMMGDAIYRQADELLRKIIKLVVEEKPING
jgi:hypothetical protein